MSGIDRTATMTANNAPSPNVASASSEAVGTDAYKAFDKDLVSGTWQVTSGTTGFLKFDFGSALWASDEYRITAQTGSRAPSAWTFDGSNNDSDWTQLDSQTSQTFSTQETKTYTFSNTTKYRYYRVNVSAGAGSPLEIGELNIYAPDAATGGGAPFMSY